MRVFTVPDEDLPADHDWLMVYDGERAAVFLKASHADPPHLVEVARAAEALQLVDAGPALVGASL